MNQKTSERRFVYLLNVAHKRVQGWISAQEAGATAARSGVLMAIRDGDAGAACSEVGKALSLGPSALSGLIDRMEQAKLVARLPDPDDGRAFRLALTVHGRAARKVAVQRARELNARLSEGFSDDELAVVARWLLSVQDKFSKESDK